MAPTVVLGISRIGRPAYSVELLIDLDRSSSAFGDLFGGLVRLLMAAENGDDYQAYARISLEEGTR